MSAAIPSLLMQAARSAAVADGLVVDDVINSNGRRNSGSSTQSGQQGVRGQSGYPKHVVSHKPSPSPRPSSTPTPGGSSGGGKKKGAPLRRGKWTPEEEAYATRLIQEFKAGLLPLTDGTTLRTFLSKLLNCDPMRISKKFVGSNCIGKQVFRRRTADINRLTPEQIAASQKELSELERRFLERVAQTNRVKSTSNGGTVPVPVSSSTAAGIGTKEDDSADFGDSNQNEFSHLSQQSQSNSHQQTGEVDALHRDAPTPPWLKPPISILNHGLNHRQNSVSNNRAAAVGRALLNGSLNHNKTSTHNSGFGHNGTLVESKPGPPTNTLAELNANANANANASAALRGLGQTSSAGLFALAEMQRRQNMQSQASTLQQLATFQNQGSAQGLAALAGTGFSSAALQQLARTTSAARLAGLAASTTSMSNLLKAGLSRDQLSQLARDGHFASTHSLTNMMDRQSSFDALMSLDFQSLQSIDNLANLIQGGVGQGGLSSNNIPKTGLKNWSVEAGLGTGQSNGNLAGSLANARRLASQGRMDSLIRSLSAGHGLSSGNLVRALGSNADAGSGASPNASFSSLLQNLSGNFNGSSVDNIQNLLGNNNSVSGVAGNNPFSAMSLANMLRVDSSTGLTALRVKDGLNGRNTSVDDFLSLVASGDIPHQDPHMLNVPLQSVMQGAGNGAPGDPIGGPSGSAGAPGSGGNSSSNQTGAQAAATYLAHQQLLAQAAAGNSCNNSSNALSEALLASSSSAFLNQLSQGNAAATNAVAAVLAQQQNASLSANALAVARAQLEGMGKRKFGSLEGEFSSQIGAKR